MDAPHYLKAELYDRIQREPEIFDFLQSASLDGLWYWDLEDPEHEWMNEGFWRLFGIDPATKAHNPAEWQDIIHPDDLELALDNFHKHLADPNHPYDQIVRYRHADGSMITVRCRGLAIRDKTGKPVRMLGAHTDLTAQRRAEAGLDAARLDFDNQIEQARAAGEAKDAFLSTMSHEIKTPLNAISGFFQLLERTELTDKQRQWAQKGQEAAQNLHKTLGLVLDAARVRDETLPNLTRRMAVADIVTHAEACLEGGIAKADKPLDYSVDVCAKMVGAVQTDPFKVQQILNNLIDNAIKFTKAGRIDVRIRPVSDDVPSFEIIVRDTGIGLPSQHHSMIFQSFQQVQDGPARPFGGSGLGLTIARRLARSMDGDLTVSSDGVSGSAFTLRLPTGVCDVQAQTEPEI